MQAEGRIVRRRYRNRVTAGRELGTLLADECPSACDPDLVVLGLPRGGVPVAAAAAARKRPTFLFVGAPLRVPGGTGSPMNPLAVF